MCDPSHGSSDSWRAAGLSEENAAHGKVSVCRLPEIIRAFCGADGRMEIKMGKNELSCDCDVIHEDIVARVAGKMPPEEEFFELSDFFKVFGDSTRIRILWALDESEMCVCDIAVLLNMTKSAVSHQLRQLRASDLVKTRRDGKVIFYSLADDHVKRIIEMAVEHLEERNDR